MRVYMLIMCFFWVIMGFVFMEKSVSSAWVMCIIVASIWGVGANIVGYLDTCMKEMKNGKV